MQTENSHSDTPTYGFHSEGESKTEFVDFGTKTGDSFHLGYMLGGKNGLGIDLSKKNVALAQSRGLNVIEGDATNLDLPDRCVRFSTLSHFLEHLPTLELATQAISTALRIANEAVYMAGPVYDDEEYLNSLGFKPYWADWDGHTCHLTCKQLEEILANNGVKKENYTIIMHAGFKSTASPLIHPLSSPPNQHNYSLYEHPPKRHLRLTKTCYFEWRCIVSLNGQDWSRHKLLTELVKPSCKFPRTESFLKKIFSF